MVVIKQATTIQPGGVVQITSDRLPEGARAKVIIFVDEPVPNTPAMFPTMRSLIGAARGSFKSPDDIDTFLRAERDSWET